MDGIDSFFSPVVLVVTFVVSADAPATFEGLSSLDIVSDGRSTTVAERSLVMLACGGTGVVCAWLDAACD